MAIKDYWVYQKRDVPTPWALYIVKEYDKRKVNSAITLDFTVYHEAIGNYTHSQSFIGLHCESVDEYVGDIGGKILELTGVFNDEDKAQLKRAIEDALIF